LLTVLAQQSPIFQDPCNRNLQKTGFSEKPVFSVSRGGTETIPNPAI
jgi:hypothetical protein